MANGLWDRSGIDTRWPKFWFCCELTIGMNRSIDIGFCYIIIIYMYIDFITPIKPLMVALFKIYMVILKCVICNLNWIRKQILVNPRVKFSYRDVNGVSSKALLSQIMSRRTDATRILWMRYLHTICMYCLHFKALYIYRYIYTYIYIYI